jgi:hypothetical protein
MWARVLGLMSAALLCMARDIACEFNAFRTALDLTLAFRLKPAASRFRPDAALRFAPCTPNER